MRFKTITLLALTGILSLTAVHANEDARQMVELPDMMRDHMMSNMRDHLSAINDILRHLAADELDEAADVAEDRLGFSALGPHGASHMAKFMPEGMQAAGTSMHRAASQFARIAQEGEVLPAYAKLTEITAACVSCHAGYRVQ